jgi:hypothetical protein
MLRDEVANRGTVDSPFGYVYLNDTRVGFSGGIAWQTFGYESTNEDLEEATEILTDHFGYSWSYAPIEEEDDEDWGEWDDEGDSYYEDDENEDEDEDF